MLSGGWAVWKQHGLLALAGDVQAATL